MKLSALGEFGFIDLIASRFITDLPNGIEGIGDDCAIIPTESSKSTLITTDILIENIHFITSKISPQDLGYKALAVNLSDIAAMGGTPLYAFLSLGLTANVDVPWIDAFYEGFHELAKLEHVHLLGGDTSLSKTDLIINVTLVGEITTKNIKRRNSAKSGDLICCTAYLGDSAAGLQVLLQDIPKDAITLPLISSHNKPHPNTKEGLWLAKCPSVHAMIDVSDGIDSDLYHLMRASKCGASIDLEKLPISSNLKTVCDKYAWNALELAAAGGEDYCLLVSMEASEYEMLSATFLKTFGKPLYLIGKITGNQGPLNYFFNAKPTELQKKGFTHF